MELQKKELLAGLKACEGLIKKSPTPIMEMARLFSQDGTIKLWAANPSAAVECEVGKSEERIDVCILPGPFITVAKSVKDLVEIKVNQGLDIITPGGVMTMEAMPGSEYPRLKMFEEKEPFGQSSLPQLKEAIEHAARYSHKNDQFVVHGVKIKSEGSKVIVYGTDTHSFLRIEVDAEGKKGSWVIPPEAGAYLSNLDGVDGNILVSDEYFAIQSEGWVLTMNSRDGGYPDATMDKMASEELGGEIVVDETFIKALELVGSFSSQLGVVSLEAQGGVLTIAGMDDMGIYHGEQKVSVQGDLASVRVNYKPLLEPLKISSQYSQDIRVKIGSGRLKVEPCPGWIYLQALIV